MLTRFARTHFWIRMVSKVLSVPALVVRSGERDQTPASPVCRLTRFPSQPAKVRAKKAAAPSLLAFGDEVAGKDMTDAEIEAAIVARHQERAGDPNVESNELATLGPCGGEGEGTEDQTQGHLQDGFGMVISNV